MALCINQSGTWRDASTVCVNQSGTWRNIQTGCINQSGTWRQFGFIALGDAYEGGFLICQSGGTRWVVAPTTAEVCRNWSTRNDANTRAQQVSGCTGWFVPTRPQLQNPGYTCRTYWDVYCSPPPYGDCYWTSTECTPSSAVIVDFATGSLNTEDKGFQRFVRSFRCVSY